MLACSLSFPNSWAPVPPFLKMCYKLLEYRGQRWNDMVTKAPSFDGLRPNSVVSSRAKRSNRSRGTLDEVALRRELRRMGLRFRNNVRTLPGRPDILFSAERVAVFCDGDFWHGRNWNLLRRKLRQGWNAVYWLAKIRSNMQRDRRSTALLRELGWHVIRVWEGEIHKDPLGVAKRVIKTIQARRRRIASRMPTEGPSS